ncbi:hypothetical protein BpHYR1_024510 [Brachionus plicatilis]|uniref:Uncharacterized protein n=1 Tax=Brachionus plicatilis TaxID=10195 RepID=A0A3M7QKG8_BRAPC|nr:hypothetical protein BpHYR1_024510 [Brachionus plicatilis]
MPDCSFTISKLAHHVNKEYCELTKTKRAEEFINFFEFLHEQILEFYELGEDEFFSSLIVFFEPTNKLDILGTNPDFEKKEKKNLSH